jgi:hypothetical protein
VNVHDFVDKDRCTTFPVHDGLTQDMSIEQREQTMVARAEERQNSLLSAKEAKEKLAMAAEEQAAEHARARDAEQAEKQRLIEKLSEPSGIPDEDVMQRAAAIVERAISNGLSEVQVYRFPNQLCTDGGRAISQAEAGWERTLTGVPAEIYGFWDRKLRPLGYKIRFEILEWPGGLRGDVGVTLRWV